MPSASAAQLKRGLWNPTDAADRPSNRCRPRRASTPSMRSVYALSKYDQERLCLMVGGAYDIPTVALRFFNVYGPHQALSNPYSGVLAIFAARLLNDRPPLIFEDGRAAPRLRLCRRHRRGLPAGVDLRGVRSAAPSMSAAAGRPASVKRRCCLANALGVPIEPEITGECRVGDVRHCFPDIGEARRGARLSSRGPRSKSALTEAGPLARWPDRGRSGRRGPRRLCGARG